MKNKVINLCLITLGLFIFSLVIAVTQVCIVAAQTDKTETSAVYLSDMMPLPGSTTYVAGQDPAGNPLLINGEEFKKGLCVTANSELNYKIDGKYSTFKTVAGHSDAYIEYPGKLTFSIYGDGKQIYESKPLTSKEKKAISVKVDGVRNLSLRVSSDGPTSQFVIWGDASLN